MNTRFIGMRLSYFLLAIILLIYGLIMAKQFLYPLAFGVMLSYLLYPIVNFLEKKGIPRIFSILLPILTTIAVFVFLAILILKRVNLFLDELPYFKEKTLAHITEMQQYLDNEFGIPSTRIRNFITMSISNIGTEYGKVFTATTGTIFVILMQPVFVFVFLYYRTKFAYFILKAVGRENRMIAIQVLREIATVVTRYMLGVTTVVIILCFLNPAGYLIIGIEYPVLLGIISALFSFVPYFGNFIGGAVPFLFALLTEDSYVYPLRVAIYVYFMHFVENNILSPNIVGNNIRLNPFVIILGLIAGGMIWGLPGLLVSIPFLAIFNIILKRVPGMHPYAYLLGTKGTKRHELTLENIKRVFRNIASRKKKKAGPHQRLSRSE
jgi:predicted PurR-regulated permease PerM